MKCIIIDHESASARRLSDHIASTQGLELIDICTDARTAEQSAAGADLIFIETEVPGLNGPEWIRALGAGQQVIIVSRSPRYAMEAFELGVADYLLKPVSAGRFAKAMGKVRAIAEKAPPQPVDNPADYFFVKSDNKFEKINRNDILYIEGLQNYITIQTQTKKVITYSSLKSIENYLCEKEFLRIQRSFIVSISKIDSIDSEDVVIGKTSIPISRAIRESVLKTILNNRLYKYQC